jgi:hypothetical protein
MKLALEHILHLIAGEAGPERVSEELDSFIERFP